MGLTDLSGLRDYLPDALRNTSIAFIVFQPEGKVRACNGAFIRLFGYAEAELRSMRWPDDFLVRETGLDVAEVGKNLGCSGAPFRHEDRLRKKDGTVVDAEVFSHEMSRPDGSVPFYYSIIADITGRKAVEEALRQSEEKYRLVFEAAGDGIGIQDARTGDNIEINGAMCRMYGYSCSEFMRLDPRELMGGTSPYDLEHGLEKIRDARTGKPQQFEWQARHRDGHLFWVEIGLRQVIIGQRECVMSIVRDITARKDAQQAIRESEGNLARSQQMARLGSLVWDFHSDVLKSSDETYRILGLQPRKRPLTKEIFIGHILPEDRGLLEVSIKDRAKYKEQYGIEFRIRREDGAIRWVHCEGKVLHGPGNEAKIYKTMQDVTEQKKLDEELKLREREVATLLNSLDAYAFFKDVNSVYRMANRKFCDALEIDPEDLAGSSEYDLFPRDLAEKHMASDRAVIDTGKPIFIQDSEMVDHGRRISVAARKVPIVDENGSVKGIIGVAMDISEVRRGEQALEDAKAQTELYLDLMSHDINNMNQVAKGFLELAAEKLRTGGHLGPDELNLVEKPLKQLENSSRLIDNVKKLKSSASGELTSHVMDLGKVLGEVLERCGHVPDRVVRLDYRPEAGLLVRANELLYDVFGNLVGNAIVHSDPARPLNLRIDVTHFFEGDREFHKVAIEDDGPGIPDELKKRLFRRSQRGRESMGGSGLGLYLVNMLVRDFGGRVWVEDRVPGDRTRGSRFVVELPRLAPEPAPAEGQARA